MATTTVSVHLDGEDQITLHSASVPPNGETTYWIHLGSQVSVHLPAGPALRRNVGLVLTRIGAKVLSESEATLDRDAPAVDAPEPTPTDELPF